MKKVYILLVVLVFLYTATLIFAGIGFFRENTAAASGPDSAEEQTVIPDDSGKQSEIQPVFDLDKKMGISFPDVSPNISVQMGKISLYVFFLDDGAWTTAESELSGKDGLSPIRNGIMMQTHEDAFDLINSRVMEEAHIEYWPSVVEGFSLLLDADGMPRTEEKLPDPFVGTFLLMDTQRKQICIYIMETDT